MDVTLPGRPSWRGSLHPIRETEREIARIFGQFGFVVVESPEVETDELNFEALNIPADHPARDLWDTIYVPIRRRRGPRRTAPTLAAPDPHLARPDPRDARVAAAHPHPHARAAASATRRSTRRHAFEFFQVEGLMVDEGTSMATLRGLLDAFAHALFGAGRPTRFRPGYYPFTEPSVAFDIQLRRVRRLGLPGVRPDRLDDHPRRGHGPPGRARATAASTRSATRASPSAWARTASRCCATPSGDIRAFLANDLRFLERFRMRVPLSWLREYVDVDLSPEALAERLTLLGMEVQGIERIGDDWHNVVVGELLEVARPPELHPAVADHGPTSGDGTERSRSCAARTNIAAGQRVPVALPGAVLPGTGASRSHAHRRRREPGDAVLGRRARADYGRCGRHPHPARRTRPSASALADLVGRRGAGRGRQAQPGRRAVHRRAGARGRGGDRRAAALAGDHGRGVG